MRSLLGKRAHCHPQRDSCLQPSASPVSSQMEGNPKPSSSGHPLPQSFISWKEEKANKHWGRGKLFLCRAHMRHAQCTPSAHPAHTQLTPTPLLAEQRLPQSGWGERLTSRGLGLCPRLRMDQAGLPRNPASALRPALGLPCPSHQMKFKVASGPGIMRARWPVSSGSGEVPGAA